MNHLPKLEIHLLGAPQIGYHGVVSTERPAAKAQALLYYLAMTGRPHTRVALATLLWGEHGEGEARRNLRKVIQQLREYFGAYLTIDPQTVGFHSAGVYWVDGAEFASQIAEGLAAYPERLQQAIALYHGDFLEGFYVREAPDFEAWMLAERARLRELMLQGVDTLAVRTANQGDLPQAIAWARRLLALEPWREETHRQLMRWLAQNGQRGAALRQYEECERVLRTELDAEPAPETVALAQSIKSMSLEAKTPPAIIHTNLPVPVSSFIGRQREMAEVKARLTAANARRTPAEDSQSILDRRRPVDRLVTLTGAGGSGKTRLAIQIATNLVDMYQDGAWWVDLAPLLDDQTSVPQALAKALRVAEVPNENLSDTLPRFLQTKQALLVLDNCERLVDACASLAYALISRCPTLQILATSREPLGITGERVYQVPPLALPDPHIVLLPEFLLRSEAIQLFVERGQALNASFGLTGENAVAVWQICRKLDGMPLAIELAAARVRVLPVEQIAARLNDSLNLLTVGSRTAPPRHQTLRATIDWSYDLLVDAERVLLRRLSVFAGSFPFEAVERVCGPLPTPMLNLLSHLVDKSLVLVEHDGDEVYYRLLETIREYAREKLLASGEEAPLRMSHLSFYIQLAEAVAPEFYRTGQERWLTALARDHDNVRVALRWAIEQGKRAEALRLAGAMGQFWSVRGYYSEGRQWLEQALALSQQVDSSIDSAAAVRSWHAEALLQAGLLVWQHCDFAGARALLEESVTLYRELDNWHRLGLGLTNLGAVAFEQGDYAAAQAIYEELLAAARELGNKHYIGVLLHGLGLAALNQGDYAVAQTLLDESLTHLQAVGHMLGITYTLNALGNLANLQRDYGAAQTLYSETLALRRELGYKRGVAATLGDVANVTAKQGDYAAARALYEESLSLFRELGSQRGMVNALTGLARMRQTQNCRQLATKLLAAVEALLMAMKARLDEPEHSDKQRAIASLRTQLDSDSFTTAWQEGHSFTLEQAITLARQSE